MDVEIIRSIERYIGVLDRDPRKKVHAPLADSFRRASLLSDAEETCNVGLNLYPGYLRCREVLGKVYMRKSRLTDARTELEKVAEVITDSHDLNRTLGRLYFKLNEFELAKMLLEKVAEKDPFDFEAKNMLVEINRKTGAGKDEEDDYVEYVPQTTTTDIKAIIAGTVDVAVKDPEDYAKATDEMLDSLENVEDSLDSHADRLIDEIEDAPVKPKGKTKQRKIRYNPESGKQITAAARLAQIEMELSLLDEAHLTTKKLLKTEPDNKALSTLAEKLEQRAEELEKELDKLEKKN